MIKRTKGLIKKILAPIILSSVLLASSPALAQSQEKNGFNPKISASTSFGFFKANDKRIKKMYII